MVSIDKKTYELKVCVTGFGATHLFLWCRATLGKEINFSLDITERTKTACLITWKISKLLFKVLNSFPQ